MSTHKQLLVQVLFLLLFAEFGRSLVTDMQWAQYKAKYRKHYKLDDNYHRALYNRRVQTVANHNRLYSQGKVGFRMGLNEFSDTDQGLLFRYRTAVPPSQEPGVGFVAKPPGYKQYNQITSGIDWRQYGYISAIENQGTDCLSCWAFSASGVLEAHLARKNSRLVPLSPKHLVDCVPYPSNGCFGGWVSVAFNYTRDHGIATKASYPYEPKQRDCRWKPQCSAGTLRGYVTLKNYDERELAEVVYNIGPVAVSIDHLHEEFNQYYGGILRIPSCKSDKAYLTHSVLVVGFGTDPTWGDYWLIKNSYGTEWGESGYFRLARNANNMCGVASLPQYPLV
ncbi:procathepsin L-like [Drosophila subpulchrella]|uniref:procathepsin L-like n=1 Tax=Drosophila subpulchrella TaxID=1486046 RepID=UPI0018A1331C|nr:procathepsin L-like [Drosophila subpulchrella]